MKKNYVKSQYTETWVENGIIIQTLYAAIKEISLPIAKQLVLDRKSSSKGSVMPVLVIVSNAVNVDRETSKYYQEKEPYEDICAIALYIDNWVAKVIGNLVFKVKKNPVPIELFNNKSKALLWLEQYKKS